MQIVNISFVQNKAVCPHCGANIPVAKIEPKFSKSANMEIRIKCSCKKQIGITTDIKGDFRAFKLGIK